MDREAGEGSSLRDKIGLSGAVASILSFILGFGGGASIDIYLELWAQGAAIFSFLALGVGLVIGVVVLVIWLC